MLRGMLSRIQSFLLKYRFCSNGSITLYRICYFFISNDETGKRNDETGKRNDETGKRNDETGKRNDETGKRNDETGKWND